MKISLIVAVATNNVIGKDNQLIWHLPNDLKYFKQLTTGHHIIMGRKNFESIGRALPNRTSIIVTHNTDYKVDNCIVVHSVDEALNFSKNENEVFVIGGGEIYRQTLHLADTLYITKVYHDFEGDTFFPEIDVNQWQLVSKQDFASDEKNKYSYSFLVYTKKKS